MAPNGFPRSGLAPARRGSLGGLRDVPEPPRLRAEALVFPGIFVGRLESDRRWRQRSAASPGAGHGATFTVRLPLATRPAPQAALPETAAAPEQRILIVDDNADVRMTLREMLALGGHEVHEAGDGATGIAIARTQAPDVALIDIALPDVDGYEVARRLRAGENGARMKLIAVTGFGQAEDRRRALEAGFDAHLTKPVRLEQLVRAISAP